MARKKPVQPKPNLRNYFTGRNIVYGTIAVSSFLGAVAVISTFAHPMTEALIGEPPFASRSQIADLDGKTNSALQYLQQNAINNAQDWYERYRRDVLELQLRTRQNPRDLSAARDLELAIRRRDFYRGQLDMSEQSTRQLELLLKRGK